MRNSSLAGSCAVILPLLSRRSVADKGDANCREQVLGLYNMIIRDSEQSSYVRIARVRIRADYFFRWDRPEAAYANESYSNLFKHTSYGIFLNGHNAEIIDNDLYTSASGIYLGGHGTSLENANEAVVMRNRISYGSDCYQVDSSSHVIFEQNSCTGNSLFSHGNAMGATYGGPASSFIFFAGNRIQFVFGMDQEEMTLDGGGHTVYNGPVAVSAGGLNLTMPRDPEFDKWCPNTISKWCPKLPCKCVTVNTNHTGSAVYIIGGTGQGQMRTVADGGDWLNRTWVLERPFGGVGGGVALDETSFVTFNARRERNIYRDNLFLDGGAMQLWGLMWHSIVASNRAVRAGGFIVTDYFEYSSDYFIETHHNHVEQVPYYGSPGININGKYNASADFTGPLVAASVWRGNHIDNGAWGIDGAVSDLLIEGNTMTNCEHGVQVDVNCRPWHRCNQTHRIALRSNSGLKTDDITSAVAASISSCFNQTYQNSPAVHRPLQTSALQLLDGCAAVHQAPEPV